MTARVWSALALVLRGCRAPAEHDGRGRSEPLNSINDLYMRGRTPEEQTATYQRLRDELAELGFTARVWRSQAGAV